MSQLLTASITVSRTPCLRANIEPVTSNPGQFRLIIVTFSDDPGVAIARRQPPTPAAGRASLAIVEFLQSVTIRTSAGTLPPQTPLVAAGHLGRAAFIDRGETGMHAVVATERRTPEARQHATEQRDVECCSRCGRPTVDPVTGLPDRWDWSRDAEGTLHSGHRRDRMASLLFADLDRFKAVNDTHGHRAGDAVLAAVADALRSVTRAGDLLGRVNSYVGDEFVALLPDSSATAAVALAREFQRRVNDLIVRVTTVAGTREITDLSISIGVAVRVPGQMLPDLMARADAALLAAKRTGRATVCV